MRVLKLSKNMKPFISSVSTSGPVQEAFGHTIGKPTGACVSSKTKGQIGVYSGAQMHKIVKNCAVAKGTTLDFPGVIHNGPGAKLARAKKRAAIGV